MRPYPAQTVVEAPAVPADPNHPNAAVIELDSLAFAWPGQTRPLLQIDRFELLPGERVFLRGPSGSGKSTLLSLVAGVLVPQAGKVRVLGTSMTRLGGAARDRFRADYVGIIFQQFNLIPYLSVIENTLLPCLFSQRRRRRVLARSPSLESEARRLLARLDVEDARILDQPATELSVGEQQRVAAARALIGAPEILIADEPTSSMDADRRAAFIDLLFDQCRESGSTLLFVSHDASLQEPFDRCVELAQLNRADAGAVPPLERVS